MDTENLETNINSEVRDQGSVLDNEQLQQVDRDTNEISRLNGDLGRDIGNQQSGLDRLEQGTTELHQHLERENHYSERDLEQSATADVGAEADSGQSQIEQQAESEQTQELDLGY